MYTQKKKVLSGEKQLKKRLEKENPAKLIIV